MTGIGDNKISDQMLLHMSSIRESLDNLCFRPVAGSRHEKESDLTALEQGLLPHLRTYSLNDKYRLATYINVY